MLLQELYEYYGTYAEMGRELRLSTSSYQIWRKQGYIPYTTQLIIEKKTKRLFKACESHGKPVVKRGSRIISRKEEEVDSATSL